MTAEKRALELWLRRLEVRSPLTQADRETVLSFPGQVREYRSSRDIVLLGERTHHSCLVVDGIAARFGQTGDGYRQLTAFYIVGDMADLHSAVMPVVSAPLQSALNAAIYRISHDYIREAAERSPTLARAFWRDCVADGQVASEWLLNVGRRAALVKLAHLLCELGCRYAAIGEPRDRYTLGVTQGHLGEALGLTGVHVNRVLRVLRERRLIAIDGGDLVILDWDALAATGDFRPSYLHLNREVSR